MNNLSKMLLKASFAGTFAETMLTPLYAVITKKFGGEILEAGIGYAIFCIVTGIFVAALGNTKWFERNTPSMVFWGFLIAGICDLTYIVCQNLYEFYAVQVVLGMAVGMLNPAWDAMYSEDGEDGEHGKRWSFWTGGINFVTGLSALTGAVIVTYFGYTWLFSGMAAFDLVAVYYAYKVWKEPK